MNFSHPNIKNIPANVFDTLGNTGNNFPYNSKQIPQDPVCPLVLQENKRIGIFSEEGLPILIDCVE